MIHMTIPGLPIIRDVHDLSFEIHLSESLLYYLNSHIKRQYHERRIPKSQGGFRVLACPSGDLKAVQAWINRAILEKIPIEDYATAYRPGRGIIDNVAPHQSNDYFVCLDIEDFFGSVRAGWVYALFRSLGYTPHVCHVFTNMCTYKGHLPQGGVTSPALSNILVSSMDRRIAGYCARRGVAYTRYADDMTLSGNDAGTVWVCAEFAKRIIDSEGFKVNEQKTRVLRPGGCRKITGLVVSDTHDIGIGRARKRYVRSAIHRLESGRWDRADNGTPLDAHVSGWMSYVKSVDPRGHDQLVRYRSALAARMADDRT